MLNKKQKPFTIVIDCGKKDNLYNLLWSLKQSIKHFCVMCKIHWNDDLKSSYVIEIKEFSKMVIQVKKQYDKMDFFTGEICN